MAFSNAGNIDFTTHNYVTGIDSITLATHNTSNYTITLSANLVSGAEASSVFSVNDSAASSGDTINGAAGTASESITGGSATDSITGGSGNDTLIGGTGRDTIAGGAGTNVIIGGNNPDTINLSGGHNTVTYTENNAVGSTSGDLIAGTSSTDIISGFTQGSDIIHFSGSTFLASLIANDTHGSGTVLAMADATHFTSATTGAIEYYDNGAHSFLRINTGGNTSYTTGGDITLQLSGLTTGGAGGTHTIILSSSGDISITT